jgi:hypothetical protein
VGCFESSCKTFEEEYSISCQISFPSLPLRETIRTLQGSGYDDANLQDLKKSLVLILANLDSSESGPMAAD